MKLYSFPENYEKVSDAFSVVTESGEKIGVYGCDVSAFPLNQVWPGYQRPFEQTEPTSFAMLGSDSEATLVITPKEPFESVTVRPLDKKIKPEIHGGAVKVTFPGAGQYSVEFDDMHHVLTVFIDPEKDFGIDENDENVLYFASGVHYSEEITTLDDNETVYFAPGAVVYGGFSASEKKNIRVLGYGILDNSSIERGKGSPLAFSHCENVWVEGITIVNSSSWSAHFAGCTNVTVDNIKLIGMWRYNSDGCDFTNCTNAVLRNSYLRNYDDCIVIKGLAGNTTLPVRNVYAENCVLWCDWGRAMEIGAETCAPTISDICFKNIHVIHGDSVMMDIQHGDHAEVSNIRFEDIYTEYTAKAMAGKLQTSRDEVYVNPNEKHMPLLFTILTIHTMWSHDDVTGNIADVRFKNIYVTTEDGRIPPSNIAAAADNTEITDILFENVFVNGVKQTDKKALGLDVGSTSDLPESLIVGDGDAPKKGGVVKNVVLR